jgi:hypothetical protein
MKKTTLRNYINTKFAFLSKEHKDLLVGLCYMVKGTLTDMEKAHIGGRYAMFRHILSMANFPVRTVFASHIRIDSNWKLAKLP